ncbi:MAG: xanthine dehydrogenase family protein subunit M [Fervidicoccaceae archaeon]
MSVLNRINTRVIPASFEYHEPKTLDEALKLLNELGDAARILAGGTDLLVKMKSRSIEPKHIINIKRIEGLRYISEEGGLIKIGALTTWRDLERSQQIRQKLPALYDAVKSMGSVQVRSMATIAGNLCNASPAADSAPPLLVHEAKVIAVSLRGKRTIPIDQLFLSPGKTSLLPSEMLIEIDIPLPPYNSSSSFLKLARTSMDLAKASAAVYIKMNGDVVEDAKIALGSVAPTPILAKKAAAELIGKKASEEVISKASSIVASEISPIDDIRSTAFYRRKVSPILVSDAIHMAISRLRGDGA